MASSGQGTAAAAAAATATATATAAARPAARPLRGLVLILAAAVVAALAGQTAFVKPPAGGLRGAGAAAVGGAAGEGRPQGAVKVAAAKDRDTAAPAGEDRDAPSRGDAGAEEVSAPKQLPSTLLDLLSVYFWAVFVRNVLIENYYVIPQQLREAAVVQGLGGGLHPLYPPQA